MAKLVNDDVTVPEKLHVEVEVGQLLPVDQDLRHFMRNGVWMGGEDQFGVLWLDLP